MKRFFFLCITLISMMTYSQDQNFKSTNYVSDFGDFFNEQDESKINAWISDYQKKTSIEIGVITVTKFNNTNIEEFSETQFNRLGIGKRGADNGILFVFSMEDRKSRIEVGNGMEEFLTDVNCADILDNIKPYFRTGEYSDGMMASLINVQNVLGDEAYSKKVEWLNQKKKEDAKNSAALWSEIWNIIYLILFISCIVGIFWYINYTRRKKLQEAELIEFYKDMYKDIGSDIKPTTLNNIKIKNEYERLIDIYNSFDADLLFKETNDSSEFIKIFKDFLEDLDRQISAYNSMKSHLQLKINKINTIKDIHLNAISVNRLGIQNNNKLISYGYPGLKTTDVSTKLQTLFDNVNIDPDDDIDINMTKYNKYIAYVNIILGDSTPPTQKLRQVENAISETKNNSDIDLLMLSLEKLSKYDKKNLISNMKVNVSTYKNAKSKDHLERYSDKVDLLNKIKKVLQTLKGIKSDDEYYERQRNYVSPPVSSYSSSYSSSSSSYVSGSSSSSYGSDSSSSSYGSDSSSSSDFGGGDSSGGGSSSDW